MDAVDFFLLRYETLHRTLLDDLLKGLTEAQVRGRPQPGVNTIAWLIWHAARIEDVGVNRFVVDGAQVLDDGWLSRLGVDRRDVGTAGKAALLDDFRDRADLGVAALVARDEQDVRLVARLEREGDSHVREDDGVVQRDEQVFLH